MKKKELLEIENEILKSSISQIRELLERFEQTPLERRYQFETMIHCLSGIAANVDEEYIQKKLDLRKSMGRR